MPRETSRRSYRRHKFATAASTSTRKTRTNRSSCDRVSNSKNETRKRHMFEEHELPTEAETEDYLRQLLRMYIQISSETSLKLSTLPDVRPGEPYPPHPILIKLAIWEAPGRRQTLNGIQNAIDARYPDLGKSVQTVSNEIDFMGGRGREKSTLKATEKRRVAWKDSIRHKLSQDPTFVQVKRPTNEPGRGDYWVIHFKQTKHVYC